MIRISNDAYRSRERPEEQKALDRRYRKCSHNRSPCDSVAPAMLLLRAHVQNYRSKKGATKKSSLSPLTLDLALWIILSSCNIQFPILFKCWGSFWRQSMKEISLGVGFLKLQAVQHGAERLRREPDVRCDRQFCSWWRLKSAPSA